MWENRNANVTLLLCKRSTKLSEIYINSKHFIFIIYNLLIRLLIRLPPKVAGQPGQKAMGLITFRLPI